MSGKYANARDLRDPRALPDELRKIRNRYTLSAEAKDVIKHAAEELFGLQNAHGFNVSPSSASEPAGAPSYDCWDEGFPRSKSEPAGAPSEEDVRRLLDDAVLVIERTGHMNFIVRGKPFKAYLALLRRGTE